MKIYRMHSENYAKSVIISSVDWGGGGRGGEREGLDYQTIHWKKATLKMMESHSKSEVHLLSCKLDVEADRARKEVSIISQLQNVIHQHIAHTTNFDKPVILVVSCGGETLQTFLD